MIEFLQWLEDNQWHRYKDGTYYSTSPEHYVHGTQRKFYTKEELIENYEHTNSRRNIKKLAE